MYWTGNSMNNLLSYCRLVDARISVSEKDLPVIGDGSTTAGCVANGDEPKMEAPVDWPVNFEYCLGLQFLEFENKIYTYLDDWSINNIFQELPHQMVA